ncbi:MAG: putative metal-binding protein [Candidatus Methanohalarchaeum thermophilum]|uniref:Metal-binding protein n=1 Tax=Methanohalarchaeum thermophilum TaxID=1903181 RepID=A0A1Q6DW14_METT1|nr:MAG: putative metal-binding protein [Candidatus Methanohalarchaeum thermophilum]
MKEFDKKLEEKALELGADYVQFLDIEDVVVDQRVRLKCQVPICPHYNNNLMCPPHIPSVEMFKKALKNYEKAFFVQIITSVNSLDNGNNIEDDWEERSKDHEGYKKELLDIMNELERFAFKEGYHLATGLIGGSCPLCDKCVIEEGSTECRHPYMARPSMEGLGIDVIETCKNAGIQINLSSEEKVRWNGLLLL